MGNPKIIKFTDLIAWKEGHQLVLAIYKASTTFPKDERFGLTDQLRRAAVSVTSNIAEGFSRHTAKEKTQFYYLSKGSVTEIQNQLLICRDIQYLNPEAFNHLANQTVVVHKLINGLIKSVKQL